METSLNAVRPFAKPGLELPAPEALLTALLQVLQAWDSFPLWSFQWPFDVTKPLQMQETLLIDGEQPRILLFQASAGFARLLLKGELREFGEEDGFAKAAFQAFVRIYADSVAKRDGREQAECCRVESLELYRLLSQRPVQICFSAINDEPVQISLWKLKEDLSD